MRLAVISDIHSNLDAFTAVMDDISKLKIDDIICLGDNIGYGAQPEEIIVNLKQHRISSVLGNHELAILDKDYLKTFGPFARKALKINRKRMSDQAVRYITGLQPFLVRYDCRFVHGLPPDTIAKSIFNESNQKIINIMTRLKQKITFVGHTHQLAVYELDHDVLKKKKILKCRLSLAKSRRYIINTGSVGQPRDSYNEAKYIIWDSDQYIIESRFVPYDYHNAAKMIIKAGIPKQYAEVLKKSKRRT
ncbi:MAG: metallophosphoesterase [Desulfobacula sp.]|nr:metallophosphoesterase [Desulfobacula sp.]